MTQRFDRHLPNWANAIRSAPSAAFAEGLLECLLREAEDWPTALTEFEQLSDWTHEGLVAAAMAPKAPPGCVPEGSAQAEEGRGWTATYLLTLRTMQLIGRLAMASEQALHLEDRKTAIQMMRLMSREWTHFKGQLAIEAALSDFGEGCE